MLTVGLVCMFLVTADSDDICRGESLALSQIAIRDPFILPVQEEGNYYLYGTRPTWGQEPFLCYTSRDLKKWNGPVEIFKAPEGFWAAKDFWAPEVHRWRGKYYLFASYANGKATSRGTHVSVSDTPRGPFTPLGGKPQTPLDWLCLDGTLFVDDTGTPWMIFCHEWVQVQDGEVQAVRLSADLSRAEGEPMLLFRASSAPWVGSKRDKITDGPFLYRSKTGKLLMLWSSFGDDGRYKVGLAWSVSGTHQGPWKQQAAPIFEEDGGHAMLFKDFDGRLLMLLHTPNRHPSRPTLFAMEDLGDTVAVIKQSE